MSDGMDLRRANSPTSGNAGHGYLKFQMKSSTLKLNVVAMSQTAFESLKSMGAQVNKWDKLWTAFAGVCGGCVWDIMNSESMANVNRASIFLVLIFAATAYYGYREAEDSRKKHKGILDTCEPSEADFEAVRMDRPPSDAPES